MNKTKCVFLDRDGVLNVERGNYTYKTSDFTVANGVPEALRLLKAAGYLLVVVTNQGGIAKGLYTKADLFACHQKLQTACGNLIDALYYAPSHPAISASLSRKPDSLMLEKAIARYNINPTLSWLVGDQKRDIDAAQKVGVPAIFVGEVTSAPNNIMQAPDLLAAAKIIIQRKTG
jgi:D-glycero-D-manno-heptose 1,7-bisphosphate phosphatase